MVKISINVRQETVKTCVVKITITDIDSRNMNKLLETDTKVGDRMTVESVLRFLNEAGQNKKMPSKQEDNEDKAVYKNLPQFKFSQCGISSGDIISYVRDPSITAIVQDDTHVLFCDEVLSLTKATLKAGWHGRGVGEWWMCKGKTLQELRKEQLGYFWDPVTKKTVFPGKN